MKNKVMRILLFVLLVVGMVAAFIYRDQFDAAALEYRVNNAGAAGPIVFMLIYTIGTVLFFPGSVLTLAGGALFGPVLGTFYNLSGATLGAALSFMIARYFASDWVEEKTGGRLKQLKEGVENEGWQFVAFVRLVPLFPFNLLNYALGLTRIKFSHYVIASYICMLPGAIAYTYLGYVGREAIAGEEGVIQKVLLAVALLAVVAFLPGFIGRLRRGPILSVDELKRKLDNKEELLLLDVRTTNEFCGEQGHISTAVNIPLEALPAGLDKLAGYTEKTIAIICRTDVRSSKAARLLTKNGFADVHVVKGGMTNWNGKAYPVE